MNTSDSPGAAARSGDGADYAALAVCSLIWGTTWFAITKQLGAVPPAVSVVYRFALAAALFFGLCLVQRRSLRLTAAQHRVVFLQGLFTFAVDYLFVYLAEGRVPSAVVAVGFASLALVNLILFRVALGQAASRGAWAGALLGVVGVLVLSYGELGAGAGAAVGLGFVAIAVLGAAIGNLFAFKAQLRGVEVAPGTAWAMAYGAAILAVYALVTGAPWRFEATPAYVGSLVYLSVFGSVVAFFLYFSLARRRGYALAAYVSALTPGIAMLVSALFEGARWGWSALAGLALVLGGQVLLIRAPRV